jgi:DNA-binding XRE family transcriptional regulator
MRKVRIGHTRETILSEESESAPTRIECKGVFAVDVEKARALARFETSRSEATAFRLRAVRMALGVTQKDIAEALELPTSTYADYERARVYPSHAAVSHFGRPAVAPGGARWVRADVSLLADPLALAFGRGPLAGIAPALSAERDGKPSGYAPAGASSMARLRLRRAARRSTPATRKIAR